MLFRFLPKVDIYHLFLRRCWLVHWKLKQKKDISMLKTVAVLLLVIYHENRKNKTNRILTSANALALGLASD